MPGSINVDGVAVPIQNTFNRPSLVLSNLRGVVLGLLRAAAQEVDRWYTTGRWGCFLFVCLFFGVFFLGGGGDNKMMMMMMMMTIVITTTIIIMIIMMIIIR